jgi:hypothetical protein
MKTFLVLFMIAASLPADAQRVRENISQRPGITASVQPLASGSIKSPNPKKEPSQDRNAVRKQ